MSCFEIYKKELAWVGHGIALWEPNPAGLYSSVEIGDVGFVRDGVFHRLFNVLLPSYDPSQIHGVPESFRPLRLPDVRSVYCRYLPKGLYASTDIYQISGGMKFGCPTLLPIVGDISLTCSRRRGAVLAIGDHASCEDVVARGFFRQYHKENYHSWFSFSRQLGLDLRKQDLILVTGRDLTSSWAVAVFTQTHASAKLTVKPFIPGSLSLSFSWTEGSRVHHNHGPIARHLSPGMTELDPDRKDQCIFLRGICVKRCFFLPFPRIMRAAAEGCERDYSNNDPDAPSSALVNRGFDSPSPSQVSLSESSDSDLDSEYTFHESSAGDYTPDLKAAMLDDALDDSASGVTVAHGDQTHPSLDQTAPPVHVIGVESVRSDLRLSPDQTINQPDDGSPWLRDGSANSHPNLTAEMRTGTAGEEEHSSSNFDSKFPDDGSFVPSSAEFGGKPSQEERRSSQKEIGPLRSMVEEGNPVRRLADHMRACGTGVAKECVQL